MVTGPKSENRSERNSRSMLPPLMVRSAERASRTTRPHYRHGHPSRRGASAAARDEVRNLLGAAYQISAGRSCTDSPQPQAEIWFGLLKTNWACILSAL